MNTPRRSISLRWRLLGGVVSAVALLWLVAMTISYARARHELGELLDAHLAQSASLLVAQVSEDLEEIELEHLPATDREASRIAIQLWEGERLRLHSANAPNVPLSTRERGFSTTTVDGIEWRVFSARQTDGDLVVQVGEPMRARQHVAGAALEQLAWPLLLALPLIGLGVWLAIGTGLRPLQRIAAQVGAREPLDVTPIGDADVPAEIRPLVERLNALFARTGDSIARERRFIADASHELRTPVAAIRAQAQVALHARDERESRHALAQVIRASDRAAHLIDQLLTLSRLDAGPSPAAQPRTRVATVARDVVAELASPALKRDISLSVEIPDDLEAACDATLLQIVLRNLVGNAIRHGFEGGHVDITAYREAGRTVLAVADDGPGIPPQQRGQALERFQRLAGQEVAGSGLGLAIVRRIADVVGAELTLADGIGGRGLQVRVRFAG